jgi:hypothetical protein
MSEENETMSTGILSPVAVSDVDEDVNMSADALVSERTQRAWEHGGLGTWRQWQETCMAHESDQRLNAIETG